MPRSDSQQRARILDAAVRMFAERGRRGTTIRTVGAAAGVNSALIYYYFENKEELFQECVRMVLRGFLAELAADRRGFSGGRARIEWLVDHVFRYYSAHPERLRLMAIALVLHGNLMGQCLAPLLREGVPLPLEVLRDGMDAGELRRQNPVAAWWNIIGICLFNLFTREVSAGIDWGSVGIQQPSSAERRDQILEVLSGGMVVPPGSVRAARVDKGSGLRPGRRRG